ncbi:MAG: single-stranded-DNA-specific exonuclease RecJ, partial [Candidatus Puniceispirillum sp.]
MAGDSFLGINKSASGARWVDALSNLPPLQRNRLAAALCESVPDLPLPVAAILADRGLDAASLPRYMQPKLRDLLPNPSRFKDLDKAVERLAKLVVDRRILGVFGDYDVDGAAAAALLVMVMRQLGVVCEVHIPDRCSEGYGPNTAALQALRAKG